MRAQTDGRPTIGWHPAQVQARLMGDDELAALDGLMDCPECGHECSHLMPRLAAGRVVLMCRVCAEGEEAA